MLSRRRTTAVFFGGVAIASTGFIAAITVTGLVAEEITGSARLSGLPGAIGTFGTALGATLVSILIARAGPRAGLSAGYVTATGGALLALAATARSSFPLLLGAMLVLGIGHSATQLSRYAAAELFEPAHRARAIGIIVWAGTIGSVLGPNLIEPAGRAAAAQGFPELAGGYAVTGLLFGAAALVYLASLGKAGRTLSRPSRELSSPPQVDWGSLIRLPPVRIGLTAMVVGQFVMVLIMTMTPLHIRAVGLGLGVVGLVISAHTLGMFALSPVTGWLTERFGPIRIILAGIALLAGSSALAAVAPDNGRTMLAAALFLLGLGWNFGFVAGSTLLTREVPAEARTLLQGRADSLVWMSAATASLTSGFVLAAGGYTALNLAGALLALVPLTVIIRRRWRPAADRT